MFSHNAEYPLYIGLLGDEDWADGIDGLFKVIEIGKNHFDDPDDNEPITVVAESWHADDNFPASHLNWHEGQNLFYVPDFNATGEEDGTRHTLYVTIQDAVGV